MALIGTLTSGVSALTSFSKGLEVIGNNISNVNTTGYKSSTVSYADSFSNTLSAATSSTAATQIGTGVQVASIATNYTQGSLNSTDVSTDLGISGEGFFVVQDSSGNNYATRDGEFHWDSDGYLVNTSGYYVLDNTGAKIQVSDISDMTSVTIGSDGVITTIDSSGTSATAQTVGLIKFSDVTKLMKSGGNLYDFSATGADVTSDMTSPGSTGYGTLEAGTLEASNVDLTAQFSELITAQRSFQAGSRLITVSDTVLEDIVNLKRS